MQQLPAITGKVVEIARDEQGNLKEIYRPDARTELRYPVSRGDSTLKYDNEHFTQRCNGSILECSYAFEYRERLDFYIK